MALLVTAILLSGCQLPWFGGAPSGLRLVARTDQDTLARLQGLPVDEARALSSLRPEGYDGMDMKNATFKLEVADYEAGPEEQVKDVLFADYLTALSRAQAAGANRVLPSVNLIDGITKQINDGLYARLELVLEQTRKAELRRKLYAALKAARDAHPGDKEWTTLVARAAASLKLAGEGPELDAEVQAAEDKALAEFTADALRSKPIGFYTWSDPLRTIFQADRMLQSRVPLDTAEGPIDPALREASLAGSVMATQPELAQAYDQVAHFYERMTNPFMAYSPTAIAKAKPANLGWDALSNDASARLKLYNSLKASPPEGMFMEFSLLPPSRSSEVTFFAKEPPPEGMDLMAYFIQGIRSGKVSLAPKADSGFYQYQQYALEALLKPDQNPEGQKIAFGEKYLKRLEEAFKTGIAKARETHAKQIGWGPQPTSAPPPPMKPRLFVEPIVTVYKRYGDMYAFLEREVLPLFPAEALQVKPLKEGGEGDRTLPDEVAEAKRLMYGLYLVGAANLGLTPDADLKLSDDERAKAMAAAQTWLLHYQEDARLAVDTRVAVPVTVAEPTPGHKVIRFWGTAGVTLVKIQAEFVQKPSGGYGEPEPAGYLVAADKFVAFERPYEKGVLNRDEYRRILDTSKTLDEAMRRLQGG
jgi:hypothetical protein